MKPKPRVTGFINLEPNEVVGAVRETRKGHWQYYFSYKGKRYFLQKNSDGTPLKSENEASMMRIAVSYEIKQGKFDPNSVDRTFFSFSNQMDKWVQNSNVSYEWQKKRR